MRGCSRRSFPHHPETFCKRWIYRQLLNQQTGNSEYAAPGWWKISPKNSPSIAPSVMEALWKERFDIVTLYIIRNISDVIGIVMSNLNAALRRGGAV
jgi:hypothetical protein